MGRMSGHIKKMPTKRAFGEIYSKKADGLIVKFDIAAAARATGKGKLQDGSRITYEKDGRGRGVNIKMTGLLSERRGRHKRFQRSAHWGF